MNVSEASLIFIPDISGFTHFVNTTEIEHSQHIISELLEIIIAANKLDMALAEIEGDAVLFYKESGIPSIAALLRQAEQMFVDFHQHLGRYETHRICQCGACSSASSLTLKIVAHQGKLGFTHVRNRTKPFGPGIILSHRLLKNDIPHNEYLLLTEAFFQDGTALREDYPSWAFFQEQHSVYDTIGEVPYRWTELSPLRNQIQKVSPRLPETNKRPITQSVLIDYPLNELYQIVSDLDFRVLWNSNLKKIIKDEHNINQVGARHKCIVNTKLLDIETITNDFGKGKLVYGERTRSIPIVKTLDIYYIFERQGERRTKVIAEVHFDPIPVIGFLFSALFRRKITAQVKKVLVSLKKYCELQPKPTIGRVVFKRT